MGKDTEDPRFPKVKKDPSNVVRLNVDTCLPIDPDKVLMRAVGHLNEVLVLGWGKDGKLYAASSTGYIPDAVYTAQVFVHKELNGDFGAVT